MRTTMRRTRRVGAFAAAGLAALLVASCTDIGGGVPKHLRALSYATKELIAEKGMEERSPILVRIFKDESKLEVWKKEKASGRFALLTSYDICKWSGKLGPKIKEGDRQAPEGFYTVTPALMNPNSSYYLSFNLGFPNTYDRANGRTGTFLMVHGACSSAGCYSMTDEQIQEIYTLARLSFEGGQRSFQVQAFPFRMTPENMAKHRNDPNMPFWTMLKEGYDHFEVTRQEPKIDVCSKRYVFNAEPVAGVKFSPTASCPPMSVPDPIRVAVEVKAKKDVAEMQVIAARLEAEEAKTRPPAEEAPLSKAPETMLAGDAGSAPVAVAATAAPADETAAVAAAEADSAGVPAPKPRADQTATAYLETAPAEPSGGFFSRVLRKVNPF